jgi:hypothetical protein
MRQPTQGRNLESTKWTSQIQNCLESPRGAVIVDKLDLAPETPRAEERDREDETPALLEAVLVDDADPGRAIEYDPTK